MLVLISPLSGPHCRLSVGRISRHQIHLDQEADRAGRIGFGIHIHGAILLIGTVVTAILILNTHIPVRRFLTKGQPCIFLCALFMQIQPSVQDRFHPIGDHSRPERIRFPAADRRMIAHRRRTASGHGILYPEIQNPPALLPGFPILVQISVAQQLIPDPRLLSDETELEGHRIGIHVRQLRRKRQTVRFPIPAGQFPQEVHTVPVMLFVIHRKQPVAHTLISPPPDRPHHRLKAVILSHIHGNRILLRKSFLHGVEYVTGPSGTYPEIYGGIEIIPGNLALRSRINIINRKTVAYRVGLPAHGIPIVEIIERPVFRTAHADGRDRKRRIHRRLRHDNIQIAKRHICCKAGQ